MKSVCGGKMNCTSPIAAKAIHSHVKAIATRGTRKHSKPIESGRRLAASVHSPCPTCISSPVHAVNVQVGALRVVRSTACAYHHLVALDETVPMQLLPRVLVAALKK